MRIAVIADIHGNMPALEAVLADIQRRRVDRTINLGDCVSGPLWPREVCDLLMASSSLVIRGNHDRWVSGPDPASMGPSDRDAHSNLGADQRQWLGALPTSTDAGNGIFACHGTLTDDNQYLIEEVSEHHLVRAHPSQWREMPALYAILCATEGMPANALRMLIVCGAPRAHEVFGMKWGEVQGNQWHVPENRMKGRLPRIIPLPPPLSRRRHLKRRASWRWTWRNRAGSSFSLMPMALRWWQTACM